MTRLVLFFWLPFFVTVGWLSPTTAEAGARGVRDGAGLFPQGKGIQDVDQQIEDIHRRFGVDVLIETVTAVPAERAEEFKQLKAEKFFQLWAEERALAAGVDGVYVLICNSPRHVEVLVGDSADKLVDKRARVGVRRTLEQKLARQGPEAIREAVGIVQERLDRQARDAKSGSWAWVVALVLAVVGAWLLVSLVRRMRGGKSVTPPEVVSSGAQAGQSIYRAITERPSPEADETQSVPEPLGDVPTLPYPPPAHPEPHSEGTVHG
ncbi:MAG TPA: TPM domain-containing protein [Gemmataceae bacterium]|nr:TPM domain-containing protein [Gemmataceae bacterium]